MQNKAILMFPWQGTNQKVNLGNPGKINSGHLGKDTDIAYKDRGWIMIIAPCTGLLILVWRCLFPYLL